MDADFDLVFNKTLSQKNGSMSRGPGPAKVAKISKTCPHCDVTSRNPHRKRKIVFSMSTRKLAESVEGLNSSLALAAGDLWAKKCEPIHGLARSLEGPVQSSLNQSSSHGGRAGLKPMQPMRLHWAPRHWGPAPCVWIVVHYISLLANNALVRTNIDTKDERLSP